MKEKAQHRSPQEPSVTGKSSGLDYIHSRLNPSQDEADGRKQTTKNDGKKG